MYVSVRGWIEVRHEQWDVFKRIVASHGPERYAAGFVFPSGFSWSLPVCYAADVREWAVKPLRWLVAELARMEPVDEDLDMPAGFFLLSDERQQSFSWTVRDGQVIDGPAPAELRWLGERP